MAELKGENEELRKELAAEKEKNAELLKQIAQLELTISELKSRGQGDSVTTVGTQARRVSFVVH